MTSLSSNSSSSSSSSSSGNNNNNNNNNNCFNNNNNNNNNNNSNNNNNNTNQTGSNFYRLKVEDALSYLDQVKFQFDKQPEVYNQFLDIMKEFKSQTIDTPGVISRVSTLFRGHNDLIEGFNTFLPPGYKIEIQANDSVHYTGPNSTISTLVNQNNQSLLNKTRPNNPAPQMLPIVATPVLGQAISITSGIGQNLIKNEPVKLEPLVLATIQNQSINQNSLRYQPPAKLNQTPTNIPSSSSSCSSNPTPPPQQPVPQVQNTSQNQVEFGHAINYVNKIKSRFSNQPEIYKSFLEILHTYQKQQKNLKDGIVTNNFLSEAEVYSKVANLFKNQEDLLAEFSQFLPDANQNNMNQVNNQIQAETQNLSVINAPIPTVISASSAPKTNKTNSTPSKQTTQSERPQTPLNNNNNKLNSNNLPLKRTLNNSQIPVSTNKKQKLLSQQNQQQNQQQQQQQQPQAQKSTQNQLSKQENSKSQQIVSKGQQKFNIEQSIKYGPINETNFFDKLKKALRTQQVYENFLKCLALFNQDIITRSELIKIVEPFLGKFSNLYRWFKDYVENTQFNNNPSNNNNSNSSKNENGPDNVSENSENGSNKFSNLNKTNLLNGKDKFQLPNGSNNIHLEIDYLSCKQYGASYRDISSYPQPISSGQTDLCKQVLNAAYVSFPSWSEDSTFISSKKNQYEELIFRIEDERFELDVVLETNLATIKVLENIQAKMSKMKPEEISKFKLDNKLGGESEIIHLKAVQRIYGEKSKDFIDGLKQNPNIAVPLVLKRLKSKDEEWREAKKNLEKQWREQIERNYLKSLDYLAVPFKQNDQKHLKTKSLITEIENIYFEKQEINQQQLAAQQALKSAEEPTPSKPLIQHSEPHLSFKYEDKSILEDAAALIIHHVKRQTAIQKEDKHKIKQIIYHFLPDLFFIPRGALSDDESQTEAQTEDSNSSKKLRSNLTPTSNPNTTPTRHTDTNKRRLTDIVDLERRDMPQEYKTPDDLYRLFYVDEHWYLFMRYHQILCERLHKIYRHSQHLAEQEHAESKTREKSVAEALKLRNKSDISADDYYPAFLDIVRNLLDCNIDSTQYEDTLREMFGIHAYVSFTLDKVVHNCVRQLQFLVQDDTSAQIKQTYLEESKSSQSTGGKVSNMSYTSVMSCELNYQKKIENLLNDQNVYKLISYKNSSRLTLELLDPQRDEAEDEDEEVEVEKWADYLAKYFNENNSNNDLLKAELLKRPVFLTRNAHCLKLKFNKNLNFDDKKLEKNETKLMFRKNSFKNAKKCHHTITKKMYDKFRKMNNKWLKENSVQSDSIDDWFLGENCETGFKTVCQKESWLKKAPYHVYYRYKTVQESK